ncbi:MAG TPA: formyltransferase family protein [Candidatus Limnocylindria bacterium]|nr:formyltransferase family protein [Candidatus Limnocylindria bacterium]
MRLGVLVSGRGSNLEAVLAAVADRTLAGVRPVIVISNRPGVRALDVARRHGVPALVLQRADFGGAAEARDAAIGRALAAAGADVALLAGYDRLLHPSYFAAFRAPTINIHPSLLPRHGGRGMVGPAVHAAVLAAGDVETGVTIHGVTADLDAGPVIAQVRVPVLDGDSPESLAERVLAVEHRLLVGTLARLAGEGPGMASARMPAMVEAPAGAPATQKDTQPHA